MSYDALVANGWNPLGNPETEVIDIRQTGFDLSTDVTAAVNSAAQSIGANNTPGAIVIPGVYNFQGLIDLTPCTQGVALVAPRQRANAISTSGAALRFTGTGNPARAIDMRGMNSGGVDGVSLRWTDPGFAGIMLDLAGTLTVNGKLTQIAHTLIRGEGNADGAIGVNLDQTYGIDFDHAVLYGSNIVRGKATQAQGFANRINFGPGCYIKGKASAPIRNPGEAWSFTGVTFEPLTNNVAAALAHDAGVFHQGIVFEGCYFADDSSVTAGAWVVAASQNNPIAFIGGNIMSALAAGSSFVQIDANGHGPVIIVGNPLYMASGAFLVDYGATTGHGPCIIEGNGYNSFPTTPVNATGGIPGGSIIRQPGAGVSDYVTAGTIRSHWGDVTGRYTDVYRAIGDTGDRFRVRADGTLAWGNGTGTIDVSMARSSTGQIAISSGSIIEPINTQTASYTLTPTDKTVIGNSAAAITFTLPAPGLANAGKVYTIKNIGAGAITVQVSGGTNIDNALTQTVAQWGNLSVKNSSAQWLIMP